MLARASSLGSARKSIGVLQRPLGLSLVPIKWHWLTWVPFCVDLRVVAETDGSTSYEYEQGRLTGEENRCSQSAAYGAAVGGGRWTTADAANGGLSA
jgi:hypothetical protein